MADIKKAATTPESAETQKSVSPTEKQKTPASAEVTQKSVKTEAKAEVPQEGLAEKTQRRIREFQKKLNEKDRMIDDLSRQIAELRTGGLPKEEVPNVEDYIDPQTGMVDIDGLNKAVKTAYTLAKQAQQQVQGYIQTQQEREAYTAHPELNPDAENFDKELHRITRAILNDSMWAPEDYGGRPLTFKEAADLAKQMSPKEKKKVEEQAKKEAFEQVSRREAASLEATGTPGRRGAIQSDEELEVLRRRTREGDLSAIAARLKNIPLEEK